MSKIWERKLGTRKNPPLASAAVWASGAIQTKEARHKSASPASTQWTFISDGSRKREHGCGYGLKAPYRAFTYCVKMRKGGASYTPRVSSEPRADTRVRAPNLVLGKRARFFYLWSI